MPQAMPLTNYISQSSTRRLKQRVLQARFGDGYFETAPDGINSQFEEWDLTWENLTVSERNTVVAALQAVGATDYLTWTPANDSSSKRYQVVPDKDALIYREQNVGGNLYTVTTSLVQVR